MTWTQQNATTWTDDTGGRITNMPPAGYHAYKSGKYLGRDECLEHAMARVQSMTIASDCHTHLSPLGMPAFLMLTVSERKSIRKPWSTTEMALKTYDDMDLAHLLRAYNETVEVARAKGITGYKPAVRFSDRTDAISHLQLLESTIKAWDEGQRAADRDKRKGPVPVELTKAELRHLGAAAKVAYDAAQSAAKGAPVRLKGKGATKVAAKGKKATGKAPAAKPAPLPAKGKAAGDPTAALLAAINARDGTFKWNLATCLMQSLGKAMPLATACKATYGKAENPAFNAVIVGLAKTIDEKGLPYVIQRKEKQIGIYTKK